MNEYDTARALKKIPYTELKDLVREGQVFENMSPEEKAIFLERYGWTFDELIRALLDELDDVMEEFP